MFEEEPPTDEISLKLIAHPKCVATPHLGASTVEAQYKVCGAVLNLNCSCSFCLRQRYSHIASLLFPYPIPLLCNPVQVAVEIADSIVKAAQGGQLIGAVNAPSLTNAFAPELQPWVVLATKLGQLIAQVRTLER